MITITQPKGVVTLSQGTGKVVGFTYGKVDRPKLDFSKKKNSQYFPLVL